MEFDEVIDRRALLEALNTGIGKGVRVGILDSGVASELEELEGSVLENYEVIQTHAGEPMVYRLSKGVDVIDHGTACAHIIHQLAPDAELFSIRVLDKCHRSTSTKLVAALEFAAQREWDILNLSLGTRSNYEALSRLSERAFYNRQLWIAAKDNKRPEICYPAGFASVVGVDMDYFKKATSFRFQDNRPIEVEANGVYVEAPLPDGRNQRFTGSSFACPHVTGITARLREHYPALNAFQLKMALSALGEKPIEEDFSKQSDGSKGIAKAQSKSGWQKTAAQRD